jgi:hypothetical protein
MKIIDGAQDYYDFAGMGVDPAIIYDRRELQSKQINDACGLPDGIETRSGWSVRGDDVRIQPFFAIVGGFGLPGLRVDVVRRDGTNSASQHYDVDSARRVAMMDDAWNAHIDRDMQDLTDLCVDHRIVTGQLVRDIAPLLAHHKDDPPGAWFEPVRLIEIGVQHVLPAHEAHMLVSRFVGGVLSTGPVTAEISDRSRIVKAGFDLKQSFRTRKSA